MIPTSRGVLCILFSGTFCAPGLSAQESSRPKLNFNAANVPAAVVQLVAVGPAAQGQNNDCSATGFMINEDGYILTNAHVVEKSRECLAQSPQAKLVAILADPAVAGRSTERTAPALACDVVGVDDVHDLAVLKPERLPPNNGAGRAVPYVLLGTSQVSMGAAVKVTGHPVSAWDALTQSGKIIGRKTLPLFERGDEPGEMIVVDIPLKHGSSGSPVYLESGGAVVGVVERQNTWDTFQTLAVPIRYATELLNRLGVQWHAAPN